MPGPLSSTVRLTRLPWARTSIRTVPSGPAYRQALSTSTPASRSIHSGGALISTASSGVSALTAGPTARNRSAQAWASVARSTGSLLGGGGLESNLASHSMSSTSWRSRWLSPWIRRSESRYCAASRGADRATSASALITLSGVRSSCEASAVNSSWRRRDCSTGASARRPTTSRPRNIASSRNGPAMISTSSIRLWVCWSPARLWPATSQPRWSCATFSRNGAAPPRLRGDRAPVVQGSRGEQGRRQRGRAGAVRDDLPPGVHRPEEHRGAVGVEVAARVAAGHPLPERVRMVPRDREAVAELVVVLLGHVAGDHQVEHDRADDVDDRDGRRGDGGDPDRGAGPFDSHAGQIR